MKTLKMMTLTTVVAMLVAGFALFPRLLESIMNRILMRRPFTKRNARFVTAPLPKEI